MIWECLSKPTHPPLDNWIGKIKETGVLSQWPPSSPNLNPTEYAVWATLGEEVRIPAGAPHITQLIRSHVRRSGKFRFS